MWLCSNKTLCIENRRWPDLAMNLSLPTPDLYNGTVWAEDGHSFLYLAIQRLPRLSEKKTKFRTVWICKKEKYLYKKNLFVYPWTLCIRIHKKLDPLLGSGTENWLNDGAGEVFLVPFEFWIITNDLFRKLNKNKNLKWAHFVPHYKHIHCVVVSLMVVFILK